MAQAIVRSKAVILLLLQTPKVPSCLRPNMYVYKIDMLTVAICYCFTKNSFIRLHMLHKI